MSQPILFQVYLHDIQAQIIQIKMHLPASESYRLLRLPSWIPGSYMIRDFAQHLHREEAFTTNQQRVVLTKQTKNTWLLAPSADDCVVSYAVFANDLSIRSAFINDQYAFMNGTCIFLQTLIADEQGKVLHETGIQDGQPYHVHIMRNAYLQQKKWKISTSMQEAQQHPLDSDVLMGAYQSNDYAELIDHPFVIGHLSEQSFMVGNTKFTMMFTEETQLDPTIMMADIQKICEHHFALFGAIPFDKYIFQTLVAKSGYGGLEHKNSTALLYPRAELNNTDPSKREGYETFLSLCAHELFHAWHVKRIQPACLQSPTLSEEVYTPQLWIYEGITSFYDDASLLRSGVIKESTYLKILGQNITRLLRNPGRLDQSISASSFDAWTKFYKQTPTSTHFITSYYNKGGIVALCLDIVLQQLSQGKTNLDHVMAKLWDEYGVSGIGTQDDVIETLCSTHFGVDVRGFIQQATATSMDLPLSSLLQEIGLDISMRATSAVSDKGGVPAKSTIKYAFGAIFSKLDLGVQIQSVYEGSPAHDAGCLPDDRVLAIAGWEVAMDSLHDILDTVNIGNTEFVSSVPLTVLRDGRLLTLELPIRDAIPDTVEIQIVKPELFQAWYKRGRTI